MEVNQEHHFSSIDLLFNSVTFLEKGLPTLLKLQRENLDVLWWFQND